MTYSGAGDRLYLEEPTPEEVKGLLLQMHQRALKSQLCNQLSTPRKWLAGRRHKARGICSWLVRCHKWHLPRRRHGGARNDVQQQLQDLKLRNENEGGLAARKKLHKACGKVEGAAFRRAYQMEDKGARFQPIGI